MSCRLRDRAFALCIASVTLLYACGEPTGSKDTGGGGGSDATSDTMMVESDSGTDAGMADTEMADDTSAAGDTEMMSIDDYPLAQCDELDPSKCSLPWPSNLYLAPDSERTTGYQLRFGEKSLPAKSGGGVHVEPEPYRRLDGYGLGTPIMAIFPNLDTSSMATRFDIAPSVEKDAKIVLLEVQSDGSAERIPYFAELDAQADDPKDQVLFVRPAVILEEDIRYIVAFRNLKTTSGDPIEPSEAFERLRDENVESGTVLAKRKDRFEDVFKILDDQGVSRDSLTLAWDFRTASSDGIHGRMLKMRKDAFDKVGTKGPELDFEMENVEEFADQPNGNKEFDLHIGLQIEGTYEVPHYMKRVGDSRKWIFNLNEQGEVVQNGTREAKFLMRVPHTALEGEEVGVVLYGHGLLGSREEIKARVWSKMAKEHNYIFIATDWTGMAHFDRQTAIAATTEISNFQGMADRLHQGILDFLVLGRAAKHRLANLKPLTSRNVKVDTDDVHYAGGSQGGIFGQTYMALSEEITRGFLAVPGNNYSTMLQRSVNFDIFLKSMKISYPSPADRAICIAAMQQLWSGTDPVSYASHIEEEPLISGAPDKDVLLTVSKGDYQVAVVTNEVLARSDVGIPLLENYDDMHTPWNTPTVSYPHEESGIILFDYGNPWPDRQNRPPKDDGDDPHNNLGQVKRAGELVEEFFRNEKIISICGMGPCDF